MTRFAALAFALATVAGLGQAQASANLDMYETLIRPFVQGSAAAPIAASPRIPREVVAYAGPEAPGTVVVSTSERRLYFVLEGGRAIRYGIGVGRPGFEWSGVQRVSRMAEWPAWTPPPQMLKRRPDLPRYMEGGEDNPLGARAMYLGSTLYRIHGSNEPHTIGEAVSSGCIRMLNEDVVDLYRRVKVGTKVVVLR
ncbi:MAG TPA: L,D-transpeptidase [Beijerinckiaceae bacterium]|nr:L,D-transpeptidase [Beijerinckiaceae bacterium]